MAEIAMIPVILCPNVISAAPNLLYHPSNQGLCDGQGFLGCNNTLYI
jgi:hypothetical protein